MANVSPHLKNLSTTTSSKLISLFNSMSSPSFLLAKESNPALLHILLETINNIIEHQHHHNPILLYAIIRNHVKFEILQHFDLQKALADLEERKSAKEEKPSPLSRTTSDVVLSPGAPSPDVTSPVTPATAFSVGDEEDEEEEEEEEETVVVKAGEDEDSSDDSVVGWPIKSRDCAMAAADEDDGAAEAEAAGADCGAAPL